MLYQAVLLDMDGVLIDSMPCHKSAFDAVLAPFGMSVNVEDIAGRSTKEIIAGLLSDTVDLSDQRAICQTKTALALMKLRRAGTDLLLPDARDVVKRLSSIVQVALCTSASPETASYVASDLLGDCNFTAVVTSADVSFAKPHPETYELALQQLRVSPSACLVVEDSRSGVVAGDAAGCDVAHLTHSCPGVRSCLARYHIRALRELPPLIHQE
jgi:HAD superfamily hydrolase (TIGR01509 family)